LAEEPTGDCLQAAAGGIFRPATINSSGERWSIARPMRRTG